MSQGYEGACGVPGPAGPGRYWLGPDMSSDMQAVPSAGGVFTQESRVASVPKYSQSECDW